MAVLITGGTGFIGGEIARMLLAAGEDRVALMSRSLNTKRIPDIADRVELIRGDIAQYTHVLHAVKQVKPSVIYHLGAMLSVPSEADPAGSIQTNVMGTYYILEAARLFDVEKVIFSSSIATFGSDIEDVETILDDTLQRPPLIYGATKLFGESLGRWFMRKHGLDFRGVRYPGVVGPGVRSPGVVQYTSWMIEESAKAKPFAIWVKPEMRVPLLYYKDAARGTIELANAPRESIKSVNYLLDGAPPTPTAEALASAVKKRLPNAQISWELNVEIQSILDRAMKLIDDGAARREWGWEPEYDAERMVEDFIEEVRTNPDRYDD